MSIPPHPKKGRREKAGRRKTKVRKKKKLPSFSPSQEESDKDTAGRTILAVSSALFGTTGSVPVAYQHKIPFGFWRGRFWSFSFSVGCSKTCRMGGRGGEGKKEERASIGVLRTFGENGRRARTSGGSRWLFSLSSLFSSPLQCPIPLFPFSPTSFHPDQAIKDPFAFCHFLVLRFLILSCTSFCEIFFFLFLVFERCPTSTYLHILWVLFVFVFFLPFHASSHRLQSSVILITRKKNDQFNSLKV